MVLMRPGRMILFVLGLLLHFQLSAQEQPIPDSSRKPDGFIETYRKLGLEEGKRSIQLYNSGRIIIKQFQLLEEIKETNRKIKSHLKKGIDIAEIIEGDREARRVLDIARDGVFTNQGNFQTQRNLSVSSEILNELSSKMGGYKQQVDDYTRDLIDYKDNLDSLYSDTILHIFPSDSAAVARYLRKLTVIAKELAPVDTQMKLSIIEMQDLQTRIDSVVTEINIQAEDVENYRDEVSENAFNREAPNIWQPSAFSRPFSDIVRYSYAKEFLALKYYLREHAGRIFILIVLIGFVSFFIKSLRHKMATEQVFRDDKKTHLVVKHPVLSALIIVVSLYQFVFVDPPFIFSFVLWLISAICLTVILKGFVAPFWLKYWIIMIGFFVFAGANNFVLQASRMERWLMLLLAASGGAYSVFLLITSHKLELTERKILYFIGFVACFEFASVIFNIFGRYNLAKTFMVTGYAGATVAVLFLWTARLINEGLGIASSIYKHPDKKLFYINFDRVGEKVPPFFYVLLNFGWFVLAARNFYAFKQISEPFSTILNEQRSIGSYDFSIKGVFVFVLILFCSLFLSRLISFFTSDSEINQSKADKRGRPNLGSWILLIRIVIISVGLFVALAAAGIPLDRITIILGALGVGVGLGLQHLVNNLVSGLIIAFEKPVNVGDMIQVDGMFCTMKSIGFRSSIVTASDGTNIVIPNGDLLSQHLVNYRMGKNRKRVSVPVGVAFGSDLKLVHQLLDEVLKENLNISRNPPPVVIAKGFNQSSIDFELFFWVDDVRHQFPIKSEIVASVDAKFKTNNVIIPYPQQDLHIKTMPDSR